MWCSCCGAIVLHPVVVDEVELHGRCAQWRARIRGERVIWEPDDAPGEMILSRGRSVADKARRPWPITIIV